MADTSNHQSVRGIATTTSDPRRGEQRALAARGAMGALILGVLAVVLQSAATATPMWGYFTNPDEIRSQNLGVEVWKVEIYRSKGIRAYSDVEVVRSSMSLYFGWNREK
ncbi:hypothetical protein PV325_009051 [Microctonus aethiopoides]|nr:hypothetical protein PV325_009051 [Microctonus aethiopoides]